MQIICDYYIYFQTGFVGYQLENMGIQESMIRLYLILLNIINKDIDTYNKQIYIAPNSTCVNSEAFIHGIDIKMCHIRSGGSISAHKDNNNKWTK